MTISLIIPCYNEEVNIQKGVLDKIGNYISDRVEFIEVLVVDDGSSDKSREIIKEMYVSRFPKFRLIEKAHQGKALAVMKGIEEAKGEYIIFTDIDLATPLEASVQMIDKFRGGQEIVIGSRARTRRGAPITRKLQSTGFIMLRDAFIGLNGIVDTQCGFKGFKTQAARSIIKKLKVFTHDRVAGGSSVSAGFDLEFLFVAQKMGFSVIEVPVEWRHAETKNVHFIKDSIETIKDVLKIKINDLKGLYA